MSGRAVRTGIALLVAVAAGAATGRPPARVGTCHVTTIVDVGERLEDGITHRAVPGSGSVVTLADGVRGISYDQVPEVDRSRRGDRVMTCLARVPRHCPPGDDRGRWYVTANLRTNEAWMLPDAQHLCGGL